MGENLLQRGLSRRQFIKTTAAAATMVAVGDKLFGGPVSTLVESALAAPASATDVWTNSTCNLCDQNCGIRVRAVNGVVVKVEGLPGDPQTHGKICGRSNSYPMYLYNPYRVKSPMKRTNPEKGLGVDPKWQEITWEEAYTIVADRMKAARKKDPHSYWSHNGHRVQGPLFSNLAKAFGTTNTLGSVNFCTGGANHMTAVYLQGTHSAHPFMDYNKYIIEIGGRFWGAKGNPEVIRYALQLRDQGIRNVYLAPMISPNNPNPDEWLPIKVGTDAAFALALANVMVNEIGSKYPGYDVDFIRDRTNGPYLIRPDGMYMRAEGTGDKKIKDTTRLNQEFGKPLVWDAVENKPKVFDDPSIKKMALEGKYTVQWKDMPATECKTAFQLLKEHLTTYTPEYAEKITEIPAATIRRVAKEFVDAAQIGSTIVLGGVEMRLRPAAYAYSKSMSGARGWHTQSAGKLVNVLVGNTSVPGGWGEDTTDLTPSEVDGIAKLKEYIYAPPKFPPEHASIKSLYPIIYNTNTLAWYALNDPKKYYLQHPPEVYAFSGANILGNSFTPEFIAQQLKKIPFIWGTPYHFDDIAEMADVLLPTDTHLDGNLEMFPIGPYCRTDPAFCQGPRLQQPIVDRTYNTRTADEIMIELADRIGILTGKGGLIDRENRDLADEFKLDINKRPTVADMVDREIRNESEGKVGLEDLKKTGIHFTVGEPKQLYRDVLWPTSRYRLYVEDFVWIKQQYRKDLDDLKAKHNVTLRPSNEFVLDFYRPYPVYMPRPYESLPPEYDLYAVHYKTMLHSMATFMDNAWISEFVANFDPYTMGIMIHPDTAKKRGIKNGDLIVAESPFGKATGEAALTELTRPDTIAIAGTFGASSKEMNPVANEGPLFNRLCWADEEWRDPVTGNQENAMKVKVYKKA